MTKSHRSPILTLLTDFGERDSYVGQMKGVILSNCPRASVVDLTHLVPPQDVLEASFQLATAWRAFPLGTIHIIVVDPGVGTERRLLACATGDQTFLAPDNGVLTFVLAGADSPHVVSLDNPDFWRRDVSRTFHGRDVLASVAGYLAAGVELARVGSPVDPSTVHRINVPEAQGNDRGTSAPILSIDRFGNCRTLVMREHLPDDLDRVRVRFRGAELIGVRGTYQDVRPGEPVALIGSNEALEIAVNGGSAAERFALRVLDRVQIEWR